MAPCRAGFVTRDSMTASMRRANDEGACFLTDSSTFIAERRNVPQLQKLFAGGALLANPGHTPYLTAPTPGAAIARRFGEDLVSEPVQALLRTFGVDRFGEPMDLDAAAAARSLAP